MTAAGRRGNAADAPGRRPAGAGHAPLVRNLRRTTDPSAVPAGGDRSGRLKPNGGEGDAWRGSGQWCGGSSACPVGTGRHSAFGHRASPDHIGE